MGPQLHLSSLATELFGGDHRSHAIAIALRTRGNILAESDLLDQVGIDIPENLIAEDGQQAPGASSDGELERFSEFLDQINPEDFAG